MLNEFGWLHLSDLHFRTGSHEWSQNVVCRDILSRIRSDKAALPKIEFVLVSGDLAFSGKREEYKLVSGFFDSLLDLLKLPKSRLYCVPGNHDIKRSIQKTCFAGARQILRSAAPVDEFLGDHIECKILLKRQLDFRIFAKKYCNDPTRDYFADGLGYVTAIRIGNLPICILAVNSAWLCNGGDEDERQLLVGERQLIDAVAKTQLHSPRLVIAMMHHPTDWLRDFDKNSSERHLFKECDFIHRGHLHEQQIKIVQTNSGSRCVICAAGAAFVTRQFDNSYSVVRLNLASSIAEIRSFTYSDGSFKAETQETVEIRLRGLLPENPEELAIAIAQISGASSLANYFSALLHEKKSEVPVFSENNSFFFMRPEAVEFISSEQADIVGSFLQIKNILRAFPDGEPLPVRIAECTDRILRFANHLLLFASKSSDFAAHLARCERESEAIIRFPNTRSPFQNSRAYFASLCDDQDWATLEEVAKKVIETNEPSIIAQARRYYGLSLTYSSEAAKRQEGFAILDSAISQPSVQFDDFFILASRLHATESFSKAKQVIIAGLKKYQNAALKELGGRIAIDSGDKAFGNELRSIVSQERTTK